MFSLFIFIIIYNSVRHAKSIAMQVAKMKEQKGERKAFYVAFAPRRRMICERVFEDAAVYEGLL